MGLLDGITAIAAAGVMALSTPAPSEMPVEKIIFDMANAQSMTFEELVSARDQLMYEMWNRKEWQSVEVPVGLYQIGKDIPAGRWTVKVANGYWMSALEYGGALNDNGHVAYEGKFGFQAIYNPNHKDYDQKDQKATEYTFDFEDGQWVEIDYGAVLFTPYAGLPFTFNME